jgi:hypothetical protein
MLPYDRERWLFIVKAIYECESVVEVQRNYWRRFNILYDASVCCTQWNQTQWSSNWSVVSTLCQWEERVETPILLK